MRETPRLPRAGKDLSDEPDDAFDLHPVPTRGIDHLALVTDDMPATMDFHTRVMRMQLVQVRRVPFERVRGRLACAGCAACPSRGMPDGE